MSGRFTDEQRREMARRYVVEGEGSTDIAEDFDTTRQTVGRSIKKYLDIDSLEDADPEDFYEVAEADEDDDDGEDVAAPAEEVPPDGWTGTPPSEIFRDQGQEGRRPPEEFMREFFEDYPVGVHQKFVNLVSKKAESRGLPDQAEMMNLIMDMESGVQNRYEAAMIAEDYWFEAQKYLGIAGGPQHQQQPSRRSGSAGSYIDPSQAQGQGGQSARGQGGQYHQPQQSQPQGQAQGQGQYQPPPQPQQPAPPQPPAQPTQQERNEYVDALQQRIEVMEARLENQGDSSEDLHSKANEVVTLLDQLSNIEGKLSDIRGGDGGDERVQNLERKIDSLYTELNQQAAETESPDANLAATIATSDGMSPQEKADLIQAIEGPNDPELRKEEMKLERTRALGDIVTNAIDEFAGAISGDGDESMAYQVGQFFSGLRSGKKRQQQQQAQQQQAQSQAQQQPYARAHNHQQPQPQPQQRQPQPQHQRPQPQQPQPQDDRTKPLVPPARQQPSQGKGQPRRAQPAQPQQQPQQSQSGDVPPGKARRQASQRDQGQQSEPDETDDDEGRRSLMDEPPPEPESEPEPDPEPRSEPQTQPEPEPDPAPDGGAIREMLDNFHINELRKLASQNGIAADDHWKKGDYIDALVDAGVAPGAEDGRAGA